MQPLAESISQGKCLLNLQATTMADVIRATCDFLAQTGRIPEAKVEAIVEGLMARERVAPTAIGHACAVPHYYGPEVTEPITVFIRLKHPANFGAPDRIATRFIFLLLGPPGHAEEHLDTLAAIARLMADDEFHFEASIAATQQALLEAIARHSGRNELAASTKPREVTAGLQPARRPFEGLRRDILRRLPHYVDDFRSGFQTKSLASILFLYFACLAPAITFGGIMGLETGGQIGAVEMLVATAVCGVVYALFAGQPLIILGGIGPLLIFTMILYQLCEDLGLADRFLAVYGWIGLWTSGFTLLLAVTNASNLMRYFTRFTDEIFSVLMSLIFIYEALRAIFAVFHVSFAAPNASHDTAFLALVLALGTFYVAMSLSRFRRSHFLSPWMRELLSDFGPSIALASMALVAWGLSGEITVPGLEVSSGLSTTSGRPWLVDLTAVPLSIRLGAAGPAAIATVLIFLSHNITARLVNNPQNKLQKGESYHLDLAVVGLLIAPCSLFGLPWFVAAAVRSLAHVRALSHVEEMITPSGASRERIVHVNENRVTALAIHLLIGLTLLFLPLLQYVPMATLYGIFLYMGVVSLQGTQLMERLSLWLMDRALYPATHYIRQVPIRTIHLFTLVQFVCLAILCVVNVSPYKPLRILFPVLIALLVLVRWYVGRLFNKTHLAVLDADEQPRTEESHWV